MVTINSATAQQIDVSKVRAIEHQLDDVMELTDTSILKIRLREVEEACILHPTLINKVRMGIIYHETALNLSFFSKTTYKGYAEKSFKTLSEILASADTAKELLPFIASYRASALSLVAAETKKLTLLGEAFSLFKDAAEKYADLSYLPYFLRGSVAENLPWIFFSKRKFAKQDFQTIVLKYEKDTTYANWKIMSFTYWAWAKQHQSIKYRRQALKYLDMAIRLDPDYKAGRNKAEALKLKMMQ
ncbi:hypothetical protein CLV51_102198 [Chitinophaga niastensis]|uniref:Tetratricopeptide repeat protein n=2 Tax=Chitinophaga niastensis TaxID=536980 RepID=A0A2P8HMA7_CHINA|nr:hypothetical protein CLV51_102198 [Chitinophaga niastensis]